MAPELLVAVVVVGSVAAWALFVGYLAFARPAGAPLQVPVAERQEALVGARGAPGEPLPAGEPPGSEPRPIPRRTKEDIGGVTRRWFLNRALVAAFLTAMANFLLASLDFLFPRLRGGLGAKITVGNLEEVRNVIASTRTPKFVPDGRFFVMSYEGDAKEAEKILAYKLANTPKTGLVAMYRKCPHLGCSVPWCPPAKWFECPCHGSKYSVNGEYRDGPAPRGLDRFRVDVVGGKIVVDTSVVITGPPRGTVTSQPQPEGEHCVTIAEG
ncbi:MAG: ubiquinol-cytochrome c reductase iron-sulfur subunit [Actinomycetota bacterium]